jgi:hypothetical protein
MDSKEKIVGEISDRIYNDIGTLLTTNGEYRDPPEMIAHIRTFFDAPKERIKQELISLKENPEKQDSASLVAKINEFVQVACSEGMLRLYKRPQRDDERLTRLQHISQMARWINHEVLDLLAREILASDDFRLRGEMCYALGMSKNPRFMRRLQLSLNDRNPWVRNQAREALKRLKEEGTVLQKESKEIVDLWNHLREFIRSEIAATRAESRNQTSAWDDYSRAVVNEIDQNHRAYEQEEASLIERHSGDWVVFCRGEQVAIGPERKIVIQKAMLACPDARLYIRKIGEKLSSISPIRH